MKIARYYEAEKNPLGDSVVGAGNRDYTEEEFEALPERVQRSMDAQPFFRKTKPSTATKQAAPEPPAVETQEE